VVANRTTIQMQKVLDYLSKVKSHPNAETIYNQVKKDVPSITRATVYRNLNKLVKQGKILRLEINGEFRFDADCNLHEHCVCNECGKIIEYTDKNFPKNLLESFESKEFHAHSVNVIFYGLCNKCKRRN
jgi:Fe2+ or Zn2+ uptake regulation protein